jgi:putative hydrolase of the HAD superfamily
MLKAVLFDLDDTLLDWRGFSEDWPVYERIFLRRAFDYICREKHQLDDFDAFAIEFRSRTMEAWNAGRSSLIAPHLGNILVASAEAVGVPVGLVEAKDLLNAYEWTAVPGTIPFPDVIDALVLLREKGIKIAIVTNAYQPMWLRDLEIQAHGLLDHFPDCRISAADVGYLKPHPAIFQAALDKLGITPHEAVFVGDNPIADIAGAQGAGLKAVLRVTTPTPPMLSGLIVPDAAVNSLTELPPVLDAWYPGWRN